MANIKLTNDSWETSGIYDITQGKTQRQINIDSNGALNNVNNQITPYRETGNTASRNYVKGDYLLLNGILYICIANIGVSGSFVPNGNIVQTNIGDQISTKLSTTNVAQYDTSIGGTLYDSSCTKNGHIVSASGRLTGINVTAESKSYFLIPDGYRPTSQLRSFGYLYITNVGWIPSMATINIDGTVVLGYSPSAYATTAAFAATYFSN